MKHNSHRSHFQTKQISVGQRSTTNFGKSTRGNLSPYARFPIVRIPIDMTEFATCVNPERNMHRSSTIYNWNQPKIVLKKHVDGFGVRGQQGMEFFTGNSVIIEYRLCTCILARSDSLKLNVLIMALFLNWTGVLWITCRSLWCFYQLFELQRIHWWAVR